MKWTQGSVPVASPPMLCLSHLGFLGTHICTHNHVHTRRWRGNPGRVEGEILAGQTERCGTQPKLMPLFSSACPLLWLATCVNICPLRPNTGGSSIRRGHIHVLCDSVSCMMNGWGNTSINIISCLLHSESDVVNSTLWNQLLVWM